MKINFSKEDEAGFQDDLEAEKVKAARDISITAFVIFFIFGLVDLFTAASFNEPAWTVRTIILFFIVAIIYFAEHRRPFFIRNYNMFVMSEFLSFGFGIQGIALFSPPDHMSWQNYHPALILITFALYNTSYITGRSAFITGMILLLSYTYTAIYMIPATGNNRLVSNIVFLASTNVVALISKKIMMRFSRSSFL